MKKYLTPLSFTALLVFLVSGCAKPPMLSAINAGDGVAKAGETVELKTTFEGKTAEIDKVEMIVREFPYDAPPIVFQPVEGTDNAEWINKLPVPYQAPPGVYHLELKVVLTDGTQMITAGNEENAYGKSGMVEVKIE